MAQGLLTHKRFPDGLVQQMVQIVAVRDLTLFVGQW
jgi:hypothetical protein